MIDRRWSPLLRRYPFWSFIVIAFGFSWAFWLLLPAESPGEVPVQFLVGAFGPALGAIAVSGALDPTPAPRPRPPAPPLDRLWSDCGLWRYRDLAVAGCPLRR